MIIQAEISLYPLGEGSLARRIEGFVSFLESAGLKPQTGRMSTLVVGESDELFRALQQAFEADAAQGATVMLVKVSNACPL